MRFISRFKQHLNPIEQVWRITRRENTHNVFFDDERSGRPPEITDDAKAWTITLVCQKPCELGYAAELWTLAALHKHILARAEEAGYPRLKTVTKPWLQKFLEKMDIKPFKIKYYLERKDPDFENKMHGILLVYKQVELQFDSNGNIILPDGRHSTHTISYDENPGIQAIANKYADHNPTEEKFESIWFFLYYLDFSEVHLLPYHCFMDFSPKNNLPF